MQRSCGRTGQPWWSVSARVSRFRHCARSGSWQVPSDGSRVLPVRHVDADGDISQPRSAAEDCRGPAGLAVTRRAEDCRGSRGSVIAKPRSGCGNLPGPGLGGDQGEDRHDTGVSRDDRVGGRVFASCLPLRAASRHFCLSLRAFCLLAGAIRWLMHRGRCHRGMEPHTRVIARVRSFARSEPPHLCHCEAAKQPWQSSGTRVEAGPAPALLRTADWGRWQSQRDPRKDTSQRDFSTPFGEPEDRHLPKAERSE
jgi:hypothetical protein